MRYARGVLRTGLATCEPPVSAGKPLQNNGVEQQESGRSPCARRSRGGGSISEACEAAEHLQPTGVALGIEARRVETPKVARCEARKPDPKGSAKHNYSTAVAESYVWRGVRRITTPSGMPRVQLPAMGPPWRHAGVLWNQLYPTLTRESSLSNPRYPYNAL